MHSGINIPICKLFCSEGGQFHGLWCRHFGWETGAIVVVVLFGCCAVLFDLGAVGSEGSEVPEGVYGFLRGFYHAFSALCENPTPFPTWILLLRV